MNVHEEFSCFIIGEGTLPIQCAEILFHRGHEIRGVISPDAALSNWARDKGIPHVEPTADLVAFMSRQPFDYLFSVVNTHILPEEILHLPRECAINYHDAPLPRYAGSHATSWAIMNGETAHAVTWHVMAGLVDAGDVLKQRPVAIAADDTAFTLNARCYDAAISAFVELLDELSSGRAVATRQNLEERTYFPLYKRPAAGCIFSWNGDARDIDAFVRALDFGPYPNPLGLPKLAIDGDFIIVPEIAVLDSASTAPAGTITGVAPDSLRVSTASQEVALRKALTIDGQPLSIPDLVARFDLHEGYRFRDLGRDVARRITELNGAACKHEAFWVERLAALQPVSLPYANRTARPVQHKSVPLPMPEEATTFLRGRQADWNRGDFLLAAFAAYLARIGGAPCFDIGYRGAELRRDVAGLERLFASHVPLRVDIGYEQSFAEVFYLLREQEESARRRRTYARDVVARYPALHSTPGPPEWPVVVERYPHPNPPPERGRESHPHPNPPPERGRESPLSLPGTELTLVIAADGAENRLLYDAGVLDEGGVEKVLRQFTVFLRGIARDPDRRIADLPLLSDEERRHVLVDLAESSFAGADGPRSLCVHELFEAQAESRPQAVAVAFEERRLTYRELNRRANQLARYLQALGVGPEVLVGICVERSPEMVVGLLGILKAGGAYVPLDPAYPQERLAFMLQDSRVPVLLTQERLREAIPEHGAEVVCLDSDWEIIAQESAENPVGRAMPDGLAYVIYTSGSTGQPKGVEISHRSLAHLLEATRPLFHFDESDVWSAFHSYAFDFSVWEIWMPLTCGSRLVVVPLRVAQSPAAFYGLLRTERVTVLNQTPSAMRQLIHATDTAGDLALRLIICGGEPFPRQMLPQLLAWNVPVWNFYGPTEATVWAAIYRAEAADAQEGAVPIGRPLPGTQIYLLDDYLQPVPIGLPGELHIGGAGLARGYFNRPGLTAEKFIPHPFSAEPGARLYKTGDLARYLPDGNIEFLGRVDHQVKIRGFRVEPGEIEAALSQHPAVRETAVLAREDVPGEKRLVAYVVPEQGCRTPTISGLRGFLGGKLPDYMLPSALVVLDALPLTPNEKVDRRALPAPDRSRPELAGDFVAPRNSVEAALAGIWAEVLGLERVGVHDNFFELGGHSLLATQVISRLRDAFQVELPLHSIFETPTVSGLAALIETSTTGVDAPPILPASREGPLPLSFAQQRLWFLDQLDAGSSVYNVPAAVRLGGPLDVSALEQSLNGIVRRHEALRTTFSVVEGQALQVVAPALALTLPVIDLRDLPEAGREVEARRLAAEEARRPFDLARGPLLRVALLRLDEEEHVLLLTVHHIVSDAWSRGVMFREITALYRAFSTGKPYPLPELPIQYADFALWQRRWLAEGEAPRQRQLAYWRRQLENLPTLQLPTDRPRPPAQTFRGATYTFALPRPLAEALRALSQREGVTLFMTLLAAFQTLLQRYSGQEDIPVGSPIANRNRREIENLIGFFVNTLVLRADLSGNPTFRALLERVRRATLGAYAHQDLPFDQLVEALQPERDLSRQPLFQVMFNLQNEPALQNLALPGLEASWLTVESGNALFDLSLDLIEQAEGLEGALEYNTDLFDPPTIARMAGHLQTLLAGVVANPEQRLADLPLLTEAERYRMLVEWNGLGTELHPLPTPPPERGRESPLSLTERGGRGESPGCFRELFEAQAGRTPDALAVVFPGEGQRSSESLTYRELNRRANQLARYLRKLGVGPEVLVGVCVQRSPEMVVGLLGVLKAGGAYLPLDPDYPPERLAFMLADSQAPVLLTQAHLLETLPVAEIAGGRVQVLCLDADWATVAQESTASLTGGAAAEDLAYVIYTSGSTGKPKGVMVENRSLAWYAETASAMYGLTANDRVLQFASLSFDISVEEIYPCLACGATLVLRTEAMLGSGPEFLQACQDWGITALFLPTAFWHELAAGLAAEPWRLPSSLRLVSFGGEKVLPERVADWQQHVGSRVQLMNGYGPTETTVVATLCKLSGETTTAWQSSLIGRAIPGAQVYILDQNLQPVPVGVPGELYIGGAGLARGYLNRPDLTAEMFVSISLLNEAAASTRLYKTGDVARYWPDGNVEYLGRFDQQVKIRGFRVELAGIEAVLAQHPAVREALVIADRDESGHKRLVAYVSPRAETQNLKRELRRFLKEKLPGFMVPAAFVLLDVLPMTPGGKLDRRALPASQLTGSELAETFVAPRSQAEELLARLWSQVLRVERVGVHDNFFELGGDSILSIQIIARANQAGLHLTPRQIFERQTVAELAEAADSASIVEAEQGPVTGPVPLTPIQRWFFAQNLPDPHHWNMPMLLEVQPTPDPALLEQAMQHLLWHHDALRLRFVSGNRQQLEGPGETPSIRQVDLSDLPATEQDAAVQATAAELQASLNLATGPLLRVALFDLGSRRPALMLIAIHHLVVDGVSWRILLEDLQTAYRQLSRGQAVQLPPKTTSFKQWAGQLAEYARSDALRSEAACWLAVPRAQAARLPLDYPQALERNSEASARTVSASLDAQATRALLQEVPAACRAQVNELLLTALAQTLAHWVEREADAGAHGRTTLLIDLEGHGREEIGAGLNLSRTVGWFTTIFPVYLELDSAAPPGEALKAIKEQLQRVPRRGIGYGLLRYLSDDAEIAEKLQALPQAEVSFNYLGRFDDEAARLPGAFRFRVLSPRHRLMGAAHGPRGSRSHLLEIDAYIAEGQLQVDWAYSERAHRRDTIERLAHSFGENLRSLIAHCQAAEAGGYTPADFPLARLDQQTLDRLLGNDRQVEDVYPLSPTQQDILRYALRPASSGVYFVQWYCTLRGRLNVPAFQRAWQHVADRHPILRTAFAWEGLAEPLQVVRRRARLPWELRDWQGLSASEQQARLAAFLRADRARGFDLTEAPLMRLALIQTGAETYRFIWSHHHLLLDGWSTSPLWRELSAFYRAFCQDRPPELPAPPRPYRAYIAWLQQQERWRSEASWQEKLREFAAPGDGDELFAEDVYDEQQIRLSTATTASLQSLARQRRLTLNSVLQGAYALLLRRYSGQEAVAYWAVVSGRPADLSGVESMVGLFINILPVRVVVSPADSLLSWLARLQQQQAELRQHDYISPQQAREHSALSQGRPLFASVLRFQNYPHPPGAFLEGEPGGGPEIGAVRWVDRWPYPLSVVVIPGPELLLQIGYDRRYFQADAVAQMLGHFQTLLEAFVANPRQSLGALLDLLE